MKLTVKIMTNHVWFKNKTMKILGINYRGGVRSYIMGEEYEDIDIC